MYQVQLYYKDKEQLNIDVLKTEITQFFNDLNNSQAYIHPITKVGFWTNIQDIRYIKVVEKEKKDGEVIEEADGGAEPLPVRDEDIEAGAEAS